MSDPDSKEEAHNQAWLIFPEIIPVGIIAIYSPIYLWDLFQQGHIAIAISGFLGWAGACYLTFACIRGHFYRLALLPMLGILGIGLLINSMLIPQ